MMELASVSDLRSYPGLNTVSQTDENWLVLLARGFSQQVENRTGRKIKLADYVEYFSPPRGSRFLQVSAFGDSTSAVSEVREDFDGVFPSDSVVDTAGYVFDAATGLLARRDSFWRSGVRSVKVTLNGGIAASSETVPADLKLACVMQVAYWYQRRNELGVTQRTMQGGSISISEPRDWLPEVQALVDPYMIHSFGASATFTASVLDQ